MNNLEKEIICKQAAFLEALLGEARGNIRAAEAISDAMRTGSFSYDLSGAARKGDQFLVVQTGPETFLSGKSKPDCSFASVIVAKLGENLTTIS